MTSIIEHEPGQELYVDWAGDKVSIIDKATGEVGMKASLFVAICPYSSLLFVTATANEKMDNWIACHVKAGVTPESTPAQTTGHNTLARRTFQCTRPGADRCG